jgi:hypothetical protein
MTQFRQGQCSSFWKAQPEATLRLCFDYDTKEASAQGETFALGVGLVENLCDESLTSRVVA